MGTELSVTPAGMEEALTSIIVELTDGEAYADQTEFNGLILTDRYTLAPLEGGGTRVTQRTVIQLKPATNRKRTKGVSHE